jgi:hypothetical protein
MINKTTLWSALLLVLGSLAGCALHPAAPDARARPRVAVGTFTRYGSFGQSGLAIYAMQRLCQALVQRELWVIDPGRVRQAEPALLEAGTPSFTLTALDQAAKTLEAEIWVFGSITSLMARDQVLRSDTPRFEVSIRVVDPYKGAVLAYESVRVQDARPQDAIAKAVKELAGRIDWHNLLPRNVQKTEETP